jgi:hypothetical protein
LFFVRLPKTPFMLSKQRIPDLIVIAVLGLLLVLLNYTGKIGIMSDYPFIFLLVMYFVGRAVTWYIITNYGDNGEDQS